MRADMRTLASDQCLHALFFLSVFVVHVLAVHGKDMNYNTGASTVEGKLNVHLVSHSHDDVGWLKTLDQYYIGSNNSIQGACIQNTLDSVVDSLQKDPHRKFVFAEMAFFYRWWNDQTSERQEQVRKVVDGGQLEFINGGWCMHDEATCHYIDMIDQTTLGHRFLKKQFNKVPRAGWQIDPFGHSAVQAYLFGVEVGFDSVHFARIDYQDRAKRLTEKSREVIWRGSKTFGSSSQIFTNVFAHHYDPPTGFNFEVDGDFVPVQDDTDRSDYNVQIRVDEFVEAALELANVTKGNHIMWTMGADFTHQYAESWYRQMDKLIHHVNLDGRVNALYSTPSIYTEAKNKEQQSWPLKTDDYFPYADGASAYWTGFFTSRPGLKRYARILSGYYLAARQLEFLAGNPSNAQGLFNLADALGIVQHHDAITGTAKQHVTDDYAKRLAIGGSEAEVIVSSSLASLLSKKGSSHEPTPPSSPFSQCQLLNISYCPPTEKDIVDNKSMVLVVYNPLGWTRNEIVRIPVNDNNLVVKDSSGKALEVQFVVLDKVTQRLRDFYVKAYLGQSSEPAPKYWLMFQASVPPLGWSTYFISRASGPGKDDSSALLRQEQNETIEIGPGDLKMSFSSSSGLLERIYNAKTNVDFPMQQNYFWYKSSTGSSDDLGNGEMDAPEAEDDGGQASSGAYIFRPQSSTPNNVSTSVPLMVNRGSVVDEIHQQFNPWIYQVTRLYKDKDHAEVEFTIGPIPRHDKIGKEVITRMTTQMSTDKVFYTDSNGRDFLKRIRDYREDWTLDVHQPVAGNYYPINLGMYTTDNKTEFSVLVDRAVGGGSINDGEVELMLHRRLTSDDAKGVGEPLDEVVCIHETDHKKICEGLTVRGNYYIGIHKAGGGANWRRTTGQEIYSPLLLAFAQENEDAWRSSYLTTGTAMDPSYSLPENVALITLQVLDDGWVLLRLAHLYEANEDANFSKLAKVELKNIFPSKTIKEVKELSLSTNQDKSEMKRMTWSVEGDNGRETETAPVRGGPIEKPNFIVELGPMEIRTLTVKL